jgi:hypothetical protein
VLADAGSGGVQTTGASSTATESASPTATETPAPLKPKVKGVPIQVLNGTDATGLAADVDILLTDAGYTQALAPGDLLTKPVPGTTVYFRPGDAADQNRTNAEHLARKYLEGVEAAVRPLNETLDANVDPKTELVVVIGEDYATAHPVA